MEKYNDLKCLQEFLEKFDMEVFKRVNREQRDKLRQEFIKNVAFNPGEEKPLLCMDSVEIAEANFQVPSYTTPQEYV